MTEWDDLKIEDTSGLTDADWAEINKLRNAYKNGGKKALTDAWDQLAKDPFRYAVVVGAFYPKMVREELRDQMAEAGITEEDLRDLIRKLERKLEGDLDSDRKH
jgi:hypothetical protein